MTDHWDQSWETTSDGEEKHVDEWWLFEMRYTGGERILDAINFDCFFGTRIGDRECWDLLKLLLVCQNLLDNKLEKLISQ